MAEVCLCVFLGVISCGGETHKQFFRKSWNNPANIQSMRFFALVSFFAPKMRLGIKRATGCSLLDVGMVCWNMACWRFKNALYWTVATSVFSHIQNHAKAPQPTTPDKSLSRASAIPSQHETNKRRKSYWGVSSSLRECMRGLFSHSREHRKL